LNEKASFYFLREKEEGFFPNFDQMKIHILKSIIYSILAISVQIKVLSAIMLPYLF